MEFVGRVTICYNNNFVTQQIRRKRMNIQIKISLVVRQPLPTN